MKKTRRNLIIISKDGMVPSVRIMGAILDFLFGDKPYYYFHCLGGSELGDVPCLLQLLNISSVVVAVTHGDGEWIFEVFSGFFEIRGFCKIVANTDGTHQALWKAARSYFYGLNKNERVFEKHLPI